MHTMLADLWMPSSEQLSLFAPELALVATIVAILLVAMAAGRSGRIAAGVALVGTLAAMLLTRVSGGEVARTGFSGLSPDAGLPMLVCDNFTIFIRLFITLFIVLVIGMWLVGQQAHRRRDGLDRPTNAGPEFFVLMLTSGLGMILMVSTTNLLMILIAVEMASLPSYAIVAGDKRSARSAEASLKYVLFGAASAGIMVYGLSLLYGAAGTLDLATMARRLAGEGGTFGPAGWVGIAAFGAGVAFKIAAVPFHFWCPDVFEGAPIEITTWLSVASKAAGLGLLLRIVVTMGTAMTTPAPVVHLAWGIGILAAVTCTVGNLAALRQTSVKRLLAYSSIAHAGYMMMAGAILTTPGDVQSGASALVAYLLVYLIMNFGAFLVTAVVAWARGDDSLSSFRGLGRQAPMLAVPMTLCLFSLVGLPPLAGFAAKWWLLYALGQGAAQQGWLWGLVVVAVINTAISLYYYVRVIREMFVAPDDGTEQLTTPGAALVMANACCVALLLLGTLFIGSLGRGADQFARSLVGTGTAAVEPAPHTLADPGRG